MTSFKRQYLLVDEQRCRRNSAPSKLIDVGSIDNDLEIYKPRASIPDVSVFLANQSGSNSSLEIDTSNLSIEHSPAPVTDDSSWRGSYQSLPVIHYEVFRRNHDEDSVWTILCSWSLWKTVFLAQIMAGCLAIMDLATMNLRKYPDLLLNNGMNFPQYALLSIIWTTRLAWRNDGRGIVEVIKLSGLRYVLLATIHVESNFLLLSALHYDSYIGSQMIDCVAASLSLVLSYVCLEVQFHLTHFCGFVISIFGAICLSFSNVMYKAGPNDEVSWGDILRIASGLFLSFNSLAQELIVKSIDSIEYLGMVGFIGSIICGLQSLVLESKKEISTNFNYWTSIISFSVVQLTFSCLAPKLLRHLGTTGLHLALLSSGFYSYLILAVLQKEKFLYFVSYAIILFGSYLFTVKRTTIGKHYFYPVKVVF